MDGYNVCGLEENGVKEANDAFQRGDMDAARVALTKEAMDFKSFSGYAVAAGVGHLQQIETSIKTKTKLRATSRWMGSRPCTA